MAHSTRSQLLVTARELFAERGFYGVSIANIATELGLTKQALLHHFPTKEKLYGEVLKEISGELEELLAEIAASSEQPAQRLRRFYARLVSDDADDAIRARLLMRELLDNRYRAETAGVWRLKPFLKSLIAMAKEAPGWSHATDAQALALVYQLLGAVNYYAISAPTLRGILGGPGARALKQAFPAQLETLVEAAIKSPPG